MKYTLSSCLYVEDMHLLNGYVSILLEFWIVIWILIPNAFLL
jgi:hypothetical protein